MDQSPWAPPPSPATDSTESMNNHYHNDDDTFIRSLYSEVLTYRVPFGTRVLFEKMCSPEFYNEVMLGAFPKNKGYGTAPLINPRFKYIFERLEEIYADELWNAIKRRGRVGSLHFNFNRADFERTGIGPPKLVCRLFLNELTRNDECSMCKRSNGKFFGMHFDVWNNGAFTTHFTW